MIWLLLTAALAQQPEYDHELELMRYVDHFLAPVSKTSGFERRRERARSYIPAILWYCKQYDLDPLLVATIIRMESSWRTTARGKLGEIGLMQVMPRHFRGFDLTTVDGQLNAGIGHLAASIAECGGSVLAGINYYGSGKCLPIGKWAKRRMRAYRRAVRRFRKQ